MQIIAGRVDHSFNCPNSFLYYKHCQSASIMPCYHTSTKQGTAAATAYPGRERGRDAQDSRKASNVTPQPATNTPRAGSQTNDDKSKPAIVETVLCAPRNMFSFKPDPVWEGSAGLLVTWFVACDFEIQTKC